MASPLRTPEGKSNWMTTEKLLAEVFAIVAFALIASLPGKQQETLTPKQTYLLAVSLLQKWIAIFSVRPPLFLRFKAFMRKVRVRPSMH